MDFDFYGAEAAADTGHHLSTRDTSIGRSFGFVELFPVLVSLLIFAGFLFQFYATLTQLTTAVTSAVAANIAVVPVTVATTAAQVQFVPFAVPSGSMFPQFSSFNGGTGFNVPIPETQSLIIEEIDGPKNQAEIIGSITEAGDSIELKPVSIEEDVQLPGVFGTFEIDSTDVISQDTNTGIGLMEASTFSIPRTQTVTPAPAPAYSELMLMESMNGGPQNFWRSARAPYFNKSRFQMPLEYENSIFNISFSKKPSYEKYSDDFMFSRRLPFRLKLKTRSARSRRWRRRYEQFHNVEEDLPSKKPRTGCNKGWYACVTSKRMQRRSEDIEAFAKALNKASHKGSFVSSIVPNVDRLPIESHFNFNSKKSNRHLGGPADQINIFTSQNRFPPSRKVYDYVSHSPKLVYQRSPYYMPNRKSTTSDSFDYAPIESKTSVSDGFNVWKIGFFFTILVASIFLVDATHRLQALSLTSRSNSNEPNWSLQEYILRQLRFAMERWDMLNPREE